MVSVAAPICWTAPVHCHVLVSRLYTQRLRRASINSCLSNGLVGSGIDRQSQLGYSLYIILAAIDAFGAVWHDVQSFNRNRF